MTCDQEAFLLALDEWESGRLAAEQQEEEDVECGELSVLVGETIVDVRISEKTETVYFRIAAQHGFTKTFALQLEADCCSETWVSEIIGTSKIIEQEVKSIVYIPMKVQEKYNLEDDRGRQEVDEAFGFKIKTQNGNAIFVFRNSSNGYYGGCVEGLVETRLETILKDDTFSLKEKDYWMND